VLAFSFQNVNQRAIKRVYKVQLFTRFYSVTLPLKHLAVIILTSLFVGACSDSVDSNAGTGFSNNNGKNQTNSTFDKQALLIDLTDKVFIPEIQNFVTDAEAQHMAITEYCASLAPELKSQVQQAWRDAMQQMQILEVMQFGPLADNKSALRNTMYSWPAPVSSCAVDQDVVHFEKGTVAGTTYDISKRTNSRRGLDALEYLLFTDTAAHSCSNESFAPQGWNDRPEEERHRVRCQFAMEVARDVVESAKQLENEWLGDVGSSEEANKIGYAELLKSVTNDSGNQEFDDLDQAINTITDALFYVDKITKDAKVGAPIGLIANSCGMAECQKDIESRISHNSLNNIRANLVAMQRVLFGTEPTQQVAFDDYLTAVDAESLATTMNNDINKVLTTIDEFESNLALTVQNEPATVQALYVDIKAVTDNLKNTFITILSLQVPPSSGGDAD
jgi:uncharacterized protein